MGVFKHWETISFTNLIISFVEAKHCPATSDVRALIAKPLPRCQTETAMRFFDERFVSSVPKCLCCYSCIRDHGDSGCASCTVLLQTFFTQNAKTKVTKTAAVDLTEALEELFLALRMDTILGKPSNEKLKGLGEPHLPPPPPQKK